MISYTEALETLREVAAQRSLESARLTLPAALGHVVRDEVRSPEAVPSFDNSAMDGFALVAALASRADANQPVRLPVMGLVAAGDRAGLPAMDASGAVEIMTGAPIPAGGFDSVVKVEEVEVRRDPAGHAQWIELRQPVKAGANLRRRGEDFEPGFPLVPSGVRLRPEHLLALASVGASEVTVARPARVAIIATGKELVDSTVRSLAPGNIRNSTAPYLLAALPACGAEARFCGIVPDDPAHFATLFRQALEGRPDLVLVTGGVSMGKFDFVRASLEEAGASVRFHKVAIRPGKPLLFAELANGPVVFGMPGNPIATAVALRFFVEPYLRAISGQRPESPFVAELTGSVPKPDGLRCFFKASLQADSKGTRATVLPGQSSFIVSSLVRANGWVVLPENGTSLPAGTTVEAFPLLPQSLGWTPEEGVAT